MRGRVTNPATDRRCKLNWIKVGIIRRMRGRLLQRVLGDAFAVTASNVSLVQNCVTWRG